ncbi:MAG: nucleoside recognition domain-containing protein [Thermodesulfobacteriota bacterium]
MHEDYMKGLSILQKARALRGALSDDFRDILVEGIYTESERIAGSVSHFEDAERKNWDIKIDRIITHPLWGLPLMFLGLAVVFWVTIVGANYPSQFLATLLFSIGDYGARLFEWLHMPWWITGFIWHGVYKGLAWVTSVMLPPMMIFFPIFTILEDLGYLPRVAFNTDWLFKKVGAHGKQALTMTMGFGCNAAGVISARIIESPREKLIAILTNNFVPCNGRFPTLIMLGIVFFASASPSSFSSIIAAGAVVGSVLVGIIFTLIVSWLLTKTILKGEASAFTLELPPYRRPSIMRVVYTSIIDRTIFVLRRAIIMAAPAGGAIWLMANIHIGNESLVKIVSDFLTPLGTAIGLDGVILLAYIIAIPANEIVVPTIIMGYLGVGAMTDLNSLSELRHLLVDQAGWTLLTASCLMLFAVLHNPCSTTILTIWKETRSRKWTLISAFMPLLIAFIVTFIVAQLWRLLQSGI